MDSTSAKTWVDFAFHAFDAVKDYILPALGGMLAGWFIPSPKNMMRKK